ncbi:MAG: hypothetical protein ACLTQI_01700 [Slackia sp.]
MNNFSDGKIYPEDPVFLPSVLVDVASAMTLGGDAPKPHLPLRGVVGKKPKAAIILAGGSGERFGHEGGKQLRKLRVAPSFRGLVAAFDAVEDIGTIVVVSAHARTNTASVPSTRSSS